MSKFSNLVIILGITITNAIKQYNMRAYVLVQFVKWALKLRKIKTRNYFFLRGKTNARVQSVNGLTYRVASGLLLALRDLGQSLHSFSMVWRVRDPTNFMSVRPPLSNSWARQMHLPRAVIFLTKNASIKSVLVVLVLY